MVRIAIVGCGDAGVSNAKAFNALPDCKVVALCDPRKDQLEEVARECGSEVRCFTNLERLQRNVEDVDLFVVATPDNQHLQVVEAALRVGAFVFIEKPLATSFDDIGHFLELDQRFPGKILFNEVWFYGDPMLELFRVRPNLGRFFGGFTSYTLRRCDRIMGAGKWRTSMTYNPAAGGLSHNFMLARQLVGSPIVAVTAWGRVLTYRELEEFGGFDTMGGMLRFKNGAHLSWFVCLAQRADDNPIGHRAGSYFLMFESGSFMTGPRPDSDQLTLCGTPIDLPEEPDEDQWPSYYLEMYRRMHEDTLRAARGQLPTNNFFFSGVNVAAACAAAFESAKEDSGWREIPEEFRF